ncbi:MAG: hypothetical protein KDA93_26805 [Planctomycetaceae bacterium]|nr:hypothetical protein [Planctomycetaceae bacterium]
MNDFEKTILLTQLTSTFGMTGLIWFVQLSHYPLFAKVGREGFAEYERLHRVRTTVVVAPLMLSEAATAVLLFQLVPDWISFHSALLGAALIMAVWVSTATLQVPQHERLSEGFESFALRKLVRTNWIRTVAWSARSVLLIQCLWQLLN